MAEMSPAEHTGLIQAFSEVAHDVDVLVVDAPGKVSASPVFDPV